MLGSMRIDRLFHVLVVHGSLLVAGCDDGSGPGEDGVSADEGPADDGAEDSASATSNPTGADDAAGDANDSADDAADDGPASTDDGPASTDDGPASTDDGSASTDEGPGSTDDGPGSESSSSGEAPELHCSTPADATDTCGCPCCWINDCINTDECCADFSDACTPPV
jgi:hypothetical protein